MQATRSGMTEAALAATFEFQSRAVGGAERLAYPCVVAGGTNATTLHYMHNNAPLRNAAQRPSGNPAQGPSNSGSAPLRGCLNSGPLQRAA